MTDEERHAKAMMCNSHGECEECPVCSGKITDTVDYLVDSIEKGKLMLTDSYDLYWRLKAMGANVVYDGRFNG